jgi:hypothetical protein
MNKLGQEFMYDVENVETSSSSKMTGAQMLSFVNTMTPGLVGALTQNELIYAAFLRNAQIMVALLPETDRIVLQNLMAKMYAKYRDLTKVDSTAGMVIEVVHTAMHQND